MSEQNNTNTHADAYNALLFLFYVIVNTQWQEGAELLHAGVTGLKAAFADISLAAEVFLEDTSLKEALSDAFSILVA